VERENDFQCKRKRKRGKKYQRMRKNGPKEFRNETKGTNGLERQIGSDLHPDVKRNIHLQGIRVRKEKRDVGGRRAGLFLVFVLLFSVPV
jgi:hypothetical protein